MQEKGTKGMMKRDRKEQKIKDRMGPPTELKKAHRKQIGIKKGREGAGKTHNLKRYRQR